MRNKLFQEALEQVPEHTHVFIRKYTDIIDRIYDIMEKKGYLQKDLAKLLDKRESEISKWLKGDHNLTLRTIAKLEVALGEEIISVRQKKDVMPLAGGKEMPVPVKHAPLAVSTLPIIQTESKPTTRSNEMRDKLKQRAPRRPKWSRNQ